MRDQYKVLAEKYSLINEEAGELYYVVTQSMCRGEHSWDGADVMDEEGIKETFYEDNALTYYSQFTRDFLPFSDFMENLDNNEVLTLRGEETIHFFSKNLDNLASHNSGWRSNTGAYSDKKLKSIDKLEYQELKELEPQVITARKAKEELYGDNPGVNIDI